MQTIDIDRSGRIWVYTPESHKTKHHGRERRIYLGPVAQGILRPWLRPELMAYLFQPKEAEAERRAGQRRNRKSPVQPSQQDRRRRTAKEGTRGEVQHRLLPPGDPVRHRKGERGGQTESPSGRVGGRGADSGLAPEPTPPQRGDSAPSGVRPGRGPGRIGTYLAGRDRGLCRAGRSQSGGGDGKGWLTG